MEEKFQKIPLERLPGDRAGTNTDRGGSYYTLAKPTEPGQHCPALSATTHPILKFVFMAGERGPWVQVFADKPDDWSSTQGTHKVKGETHLPTHA